jgi:chromosome segregation ATPase|tara:strand:- start:17230 stop:17541 length:312 start_codon:yes stop_codon:yes gene_type:complete
MTESIQRKIQEISGKMKILHSHLLEERAKNAKLESDLESLKMSLQEKNEELATKNQQLSEKESQLVQMNEQNTVSMPEESLNRSHEIDELVKEIEYCIGQLRK